MEKNLDPALVAQLLALMQRNTGSNNVGAQQWSGQQGTPLDQYTVDRRPDLQMRSGTYGESAAYDPTDVLKTLIYGTPDKGSWSVQTTPVWDDKGNFVGYSSGDGDNLGLAKFVLSSIAAGYGADALNGMSAAGGAAAGGADAATSAAWANGAGLGGDTLSAMGAAGAGTTGSAAGGLTAADLAVSDIGIGGASAGGGAAGTTTAGGTTLANAASKAASAASGSGMNLGTLAGALAGYADGQDKTQTSSRDPWAPAQPYLKGLLADGAQLYDQYKQQPFSQAQQTAYGNYGGLLDSINRNAPGLLSGFGANASGANNYDRSNPRRALTGGSQMDFSKWLPGLLGNFGTGGK